MSDILQVAGVASEWDASADPIGARRTSSVLLDPTCLTVNNDDTGIEM